MAVVRRVGAGPGTLPFAGVPGRPSKALISVSGKALWTCQTRHNPPLTRARPQSLCIETDPAAPAQPGPEWRQQMQRLAAEGQAKEQQLAALGRSFGVL